jgi:hypothetical protein
MNILTTQSWELFAGQTSHFMNWYIMKSRWPTLILRSKVKGKSGHRSIQTIQYLGNPLLDGHQTLYTCTSEKIGNPYWFWGQWVKGQTGHEKILTALYVDNHFLDGHQTLYTKSSLSAVTPTVFEVQRSKVKLDIRIYWPLNTLITLCYTDIKLCSLVHLKE